MGMEMGLGVGGVDGWIRERVYYGLTGVFGWTLLGLDFNGMLTCDLRWSEKPFHADVGKCWYRILAGINHHHAHMHV